MKRQARIRTASPQSLFVVISLGFLGVSVAACGSSGGGGTTDAGRDAGAGSDAGDATSGQGEAGADAGQVMSPTGLSASILDRRGVTARLSWTTAAAGARASGYQVRYAK